MNIFEGTYLVTGITGFLGSLLTKKLISQKAYREGKIKVIGFCRDSQKANKIYDNYDTSNLIILFSDIIEIDKVFDKYVEMKGGNAWIPDYIFHCAAVTKSSEMIKNPVETGDGIVLGTRSILKIAYKYRIKSMVYLSSMEVYGSIKNENLTEEGVLGDIDILTSRACYPLGKRMAENYCYSYYKEYDVPVKIARLAQVFGKGILSEENRVFAQFAKAVCENKNIVLHTRGSSMGNYCDSEDAIEALFILLYKGRDGDAYNIVNEENTMRIREMAEMVANRIAHGRIKVVYDIPEEEQYGFAPDTELRLSSSKIRKLGWKPSRSLDEMYLDVIEEM